MTLFFSRQDAQSLIDQLSSGRRFNRPPVRNQQVTFVPATAVGNIAAGTSSAPGYGTARFLNTDVTSPVANLGSQVNSGEVVFLRREQNSNVFVIDGAPANCCLELAELPTSISISIGEDFADLVELSPVGPWESLSACCWKVVCEPVAIEGLTSFDECIPIESFESLETSRGRGYAVDYFDLSEVTDCSHSRLPADSFVDYESLQRASYTRQMLLRYYVKSMQVEVYLMRTKSYCNGNENCKWVVAAKLIGNNTGEDRNNIQLVYQTETKIRDLLTMDDRTFTCLGERGRPRTDVDETTTIDECITKPAPTTPPTPEIARSKALSERPNRVVFAPGNATDCGASNCMPAADDVDEYTWGMSTAYAGYIRSDGTITHSAPFPLNQSGWMGFPPPPNDPSGRLSIGSDYYSCWFAGSPTLAGTGSNACMVGTKQRYSAGACWGNPALGLPGYGPFLTERRNQFTPHRTTPISISRPAFGIEFTWPT